MSDTKGKRDLRLDLLPTPTVNDSRGGRNMSSSRQDDSEHHDGTTLCDVAHLDTWGDFAAAIARHAQVIGRPPPHPTVEGVKGQPVLNPAFVEWMMMMPEGWVTACDVVLGDPRPSSIPRTGALRILGNGVVGACAFAAYSQLLQRRSA